MKRLKAFLRFGILLLCIQYLNFSCKKIFHSKDSSIDSFQINSIARSFFISKSYFLLDNCIINPIPISPNQTLDSLKWSLKRSTGSSKNEPLQFQEIQKGFMLIIDGYSFKGNLRFDLPSNPDIQDFRWSQDLGINCKYDEKSSEKLALTNYIHISYPLLDSTGRYAIIWVEVPEHGSSFDIFERKSGLWTQAYVSIPGFIY